MERNTNNNTWAEILKDINAKQNTIWETLDCSIACTLQFNDELGNEYPLLDKYLHAIHTPAMSPDRQTWFRIYKRAMEMQANIIRWKKGLTLKDWEIDEMRKAFNMNKEVLLIAKNMIEWAPENPDWETICALGDYYNEH
jgi:hypothetical protein